jgi:ribonuclease VapC
VPNPEPRTERLPKKPSGSVAETDAPASVLDASALMAHLNDETGADAVRQALNERAAISTFNWAEVLTKVAERGGDPELVSGELTAAGLLGDALVIEAVTEADCVEIARLRPLTIDQGLSLADRACLALAARLGVPALTADGIWAEAEIDADVEVIR